MRLIQFLGASPDAYVCDPSRQDQYGLVEIKCPFKYKEVSIKEACSKADFCSRITTEADGTETVHLRHNHPILRTSSGATSHHRQKMV